MEYKLATSLLELEQAYRILLKLGETYPDFSDWYWNKVIPSVMLNNDKVILAYRKNMLVGISIIKNGIENKLRALRISPQYQNNGYGLHLLDYSLKLLEDDKPVVSVAEDNLHQFSRIFINRYDFDMTYVHKGLYMPGKLEYQFNGNKESLVKKSIYY